jgi:L-fuconolactonase
VTSRNRFIDSHHHFFMGSLEAHPWLTGKWSPLQRQFGPSELEPQLADVGVTGTVLVQTLPTLDETRQFLDMAGSISWIRGVVGWVDLRGPGVNDVLSTLKDGRNGRYLVGIRHDLIDEADPRWLLRSDVMRGLKKLAGFGLVFDLLMRERHIETAVAVTRSCPDVRFVVDHLAKPAITRKPSKVWLNGMKDLSAQGNVACKISGLMTEANWQSWRLHDFRPFIEHALALFGASRCMFGSDWPVCTVVAPYRTVCATSKALMEDLGQAERAQVLGGTAARWYQLEE